MNLDFGFNVDYKLTVCKADREVPPNLPTFCFTYQGPVENLPNEKAGAIVIVKPNEGEPWLLKLSGLIEDPCSHAEGIYACPSANHFLVVVKSLGFYVDARQPKDVKPIKSLPVRKVERYPLFGLLLVLDFQIITAIGTAGILWSTKRLVQDGITIDQVTEEFIAGAGDMRANELSDADYFKVSTVDGSIISGNIWCE